MTAFASDTTETTPRPEHDHGLTGLVADIGGTHARFALTTPDDARIRAVATFEVDRHRDLAAATGAYLEVTGAHPTTMMVAVATPVIGDRVRLTNHKWSFSIDETRRRLDLESLDVINDFVAQAAAVASLHGDDDHETLHEAHGEPDAPRVVIGPGTGLGVAGLLRLGADRWLPVATEGGHRDAAASTEREWRVITELGRHFDHVSCERLLSGPGLVHIYRALHTLDDAGDVPTSMSPREIAPAAQAGDRHAAETLEIFAGQLGAVAGDLALSWGARGGVWLTGGVIAGLGDAFDREIFRQRYLAKGRFHDYVAAIPVRRVRHPHAGLLGAARLLMQTSPRHGDHT